MTNQQIMDLIDDDPPSDEPWEKSVVLTLMEMARRDERDVIAYKQKDAILVYPRGHFYSAELINTPTAL